MGVSHTESDHTAASQDTTSGDAVLESVYRAIDALNQTRPPDKRIEKAPQAPLGDALSSLDKVNLVVETEMAVEEDFGTSINLASKEAVSQGGQLFTTVASFSTFVESQLDQ
jgi:acyl carrier protein